MCHVGLSGAAELQRLAGDPGGVGSGLLNDCERVEVVSSPRGDLR